MTQITNLNYFSTLPIDAQKHILSYANSTDFPKISKVCKTFFDIIYNQGLSGINYKEFIASFYVTNNIEQLSAAMFSSEIPSTFSEELRTFCNEELSKLTLPRLQNLFFAIKRELKDLLTYQELVALTKLQRDPMIQAALKKANNFSVSIAPFQQAEIEKLSRDKNFTESVEALFDEANNRNQQMNMQAAEQAASAKQELHNELKGKVTKIKPITPPAAPLAMPPAANASFFSQDCLLFFGLVTTIFAWGIYDYLEIQNYS